MKTGVQKGSEVRKNRDGSNNVLLLQVEITDPDDVQTIELITHGGIDVKPVDGSKVFLTKVGDAWKVAPATDDGIAPEVDNGEIEIYSSTGGNKQVRVRCMNDGLLNISNTAESFDTLFDDFIDTIVNLVTIGSPSVHTLNGATKTALNNIKARFQAILGALP